MSPWYSREHDGQTTARRLPQRTSSTPSGSSTVEYDIDRAPPGPVRVTRPVRRTGRAQ